MGSEGRRSRRGASSAHDDYESVCPIERSQRPRRCGTEVSVARGRDLARPSNAIVGRAKSGDARYAAFIKNTPKPSGLPGPVRLVPLAQANLATTCASDRRFAITVRTPRTFVARSAALRIGSKTKAVRTARAGRKLSVVVDLSGRPKGTAKVRLTVRGRSGQIVKTTRTYKLCAKR